MNKNFNNMSIEELNIELANACKFGDLNMVRFLLTDQSLTKHPDIVGKIGEPFMRCCAQNHLHIAKYLLTSPELDKHIDLEAAFLDSVALNNKEFLKYIIFDLNIEKSNNIITWLESRGYDEISKWFDVRDLEKKLNAELKTDNTTKKKSKL